MGAGGIVIHCNRGLDHQVRYAEALQSGFCRHGLPATISDSARAPGDLHVVIGPWFALEPWRHGRTLYLDRAYWGDPGHVSVHWLRGGEKHYTWHAEHRDHPDGLPYKAGDRRLYLCDYRCEPEGDYDTVRRHPAQGAQRRSLAEDLAAHDIAIGRRTTALVDAALAGLAVETIDPFSPVLPISGLRDESARARWLNGLAWHNWALQDIERGEMWKHLYN